MAFEAFRFIHASGVLIDHQLRDIGTVSDHARRALIDATATSFERIVEACVDREVDFLLLTGDTFHDRDRSVRARMAIRQGFDCLADAGIEVFVVPGPSDPAAAWNQITGLPDNVTIFVPEVDEPTAVMRSGQVMATIQACLKRPAHGSDADSTESEAMGHSRIAPFRIGIIPPFESEAALPGDKIASALLGTHAVDYLALPRPFPPIETRRIERVAHCPGPATSMGRHDLGPCGCSLITVEGRNAVSVEQLATSPIRREDIHLTVGEHTNWDSLITEMRSTLEALESLNQVSVLLVQWNLKGAGDLHDSLVDAEAEAELFELLDADTSLATRCTIIHHLRLHTGHATDDDRDSHTASSGHGDPDAEDSHLFATAFFRRLDREQSIVRSALDRVRADQNVAPVLITQLERVATRVDHRAASAEVRRSARAWFEPAQDSNDANDSTPDDERNYDRTSSATTHSTSRQRPVQQTHIGHGGEHQPRNEVTRAVEPPASRMTQRPSSTPQPKQLPPPAPGSTFDDLPPPTPPVSDFNINGFGTFTTDF